MTANEWAVSPDKGGGWHDVGVGEVETTRSGLTVRRRGLFMVHATVYGAKDALMVAAAFAAARGEELRGQTVDDLRDPMFAALDEATA